MDKVLTEIYEIVDEGAESARAFYAEYDAAADAQRAVAVELGGVDCLIDWFGRVDAISFGEQPDQNWRILDATIAGDLYAAVPRRNTRAGKELYAKFETAPRLPNDAAFKKSLGWDRDMQVVEGTRHFRSVLVRTSLPQPRYFIKIPRQLNDGWFPSSKLEARREREFLELIAEHNRLIEERNGMAVGF
ncbi:hypothetical protein [Mesorhizobium sp. SP-1A]|uniref:hypothetical protein n=1 Tax=Mesorhizobium sp. SP-1A TaxID=3077840 RepID=UPI0028F742C0|nr:hypothetical protein [Mesorhizobium sp. SP-1A]